MREPDKTPADKGLSLDFDLAEPPQKVWRALTEPDKLAAWLLPSSKDGVECRPLDQEPGRRISYRWREQGSFDGVVTFSIALNAVGGTRLTIVQTDGAVALHSRGTHRRAANQNNTPLLCAA